MIARIWRAEALTANAPAYADHFANHVVPKLKRARGYEGALLLNHEFNGAVQIIVITFWKSLNAVKQFAGADIKRAVPLAKELELEVFAELRFGPDELAGRVR